MKTLYKFLSLLDTSLVLIFIMSGMFSVFIDAKEFLKQGKMCEYRISKECGISYIIVGVVIFIFNQMMNY